LIGGKIFVACVTILVIANASIWLINPVFPVDPTNWAVLLLDIFLTLAVLAIVTGKVLGTGFSDTFDALLTGLVFLLILLFNVTIPIVNLTLGFGMGTNLYNLMHYHIVTPGDPLGLIIYYYFYGIPNAIVVILIMVTFVTGLLVVYGDDS